MCRIEKCRCGWGCGFQIPIDCSDVNTDFKILQIADVDVDFKYFKVVHVDADLNFSEIADADFKFSKIADTDFKILRIVDAYANFKYSQIMDVYVKTYIYLKSSKPQE